MRSSLGGSHHRLRSTLRPSNVSIESDALYPGFLTNSSNTSQYQKSVVGVNRFHVWNETSQRMDPLFVRGVGYSPIWPSKDTLSTPFDLFTSEFKHIWLVTYLVLNIPEQNTIRLWSWDSFRDHSAFLDACWEAGLYVMVPFCSTPSDYPIISDANTAHRY